MKTQYIKAPHWQNIITASENLLEEKKNSYAKQVPCTFLYGTLFLPFSFSFLKLTLLKYDVIIRIKGVDWQCLIQDQQNVHYVTGK